MSGSVRPVNSAAAGPVDVAGIDRHRLYAHASDERHRVAAVQVRSMKRPVARVGPIKVTGVDRQAPGAVLASDDRRLAATVQLIKALGGGWD